MMTFLLLVGGLVLLIVGAELLVRGSSQLATMLGISPLVIGLTVVAFGTSSPELAVSMKAALEGNANIALGNVVGSNIFNVLFILGLSALLVPLLVSKQLIRLDVPLMIITSLITFGLALDGRLSRLDGILLFLGLIGYTGLLIRLSRKNHETPEMPAVDHSSESVVIIRKRWPRFVILVIVGLAMLGLGSQWLVTSAVTIARMLGVSDLIIGLTIIAAGTSLPEVVTSVVASLRGEREIAVGNVVGSNIFNLLSVLGLTAIVAPNGIPIEESVVRFDLPIMIAVAFVCFPIFFTGGMIARWEGALLLGYYVAYTLFLIMGANQHDALPAFATAMRFFVIPLTVVTLGVLAWRGVMTRNG